MLEQLAIKHIQEAIDKLTKATLILRNDSNRNQQKLPPKENDEGSGEDQNTSPPHKCSVKGCEVTLSNPNHTLCYEHWLESNKRIEEA